MKKMLLLLIVSVLLLSCRKSDKLELPWELRTALNNVYVEIFQLNSTLSFHSNLLYDRTTDTAFVRQVLRDLVSLEKFPLEYAFVNPQGILQIIEPPEFYPFEGADISQQEHIIKSFSNKATVLSRSFDAVEGINAVVLISPIVRNQVMQGGLTALFQAQTPLSQVLEPMMEGESFEFWVMEKGGRILYDQDEDEIGRNVFTDPVYQPFPELLTAAEKIDAEEEGRTRYSFFQAGSNTRVEKEAFWVTFSFGGVQWKIVLAKLI